MSTKPLPKHRCPVVGCETMVPDSMLMCAPHWRHVSRATALRVYREHVKEPSSEKHHAACDQAIAEAGGTS